MAHTAFKNHSPFAVPYRTAFAGETDSVVELDHGLMLRTATATGGNHTPNRSTRRWIKLRQSQHDNTVRNCIDSSPGKTTEYLFGHYADLVNLKSKE
jgi:hypothetical protein